MLSSEFIIYTWQLQTKCVECALPQVHDTFKLSRFITCDQAVTKMKLLKICTNLLVCTKCDNKPNQKSFCLHTYSLKILSVVATVLTKVYYTCSRVRPMKHSKIYKYQHASMNYRTFQEELDRLAE